MQADYKAWPDAQPAALSRSAATAIPQRAFVGATDYTSNFTHKHASKRAAARPRHHEAPSGHLYACTTYGHDHDRKPMPPKYNACVDRPWMNCDSCVPSEIPSPGAGSGLEEKTWTAPPFATGRAHMAGTTEHMDKFKDFSAAAAAPPAQA